MILGIKEDFTSNTNLDSELTSLPSSGLYLNSGVHPSVTPENLLSFLPKLEFTVSLWNSGTAYTVFTVSNNKKDLVIYNGKIWQSIQSGTNQTPADGSAYWLETNIESLRLKAFIGKVKDRVYSDLNLVKRIVNNQYLYNEGSQTHTLPNDYAGWVFEPKGSDYVSFKVNEVAIQKSGVTPVDMYVINQGNLIDTISITPDDGRLTFQDLDLTLSGKGKFILAIDSTDVISDNSYVDPLKYDGIVVYTAIGTGAAPETANYVDSQTGNGLAFNISAYFDGAKYIDNNISLFGGFVRSVFELMTFQMFLHNSNNVSNRTQRIQMNDELLLAELKREDMDSVILRYNRSLKKAKSRIEKSFDTQLIDEEDGLTITQTSV